LKKNSWGTQVELIAAATYFQVPIYAYKYSSMSCAGKRICVKPIDNKKYLHSSAVALLNNLMFQIILSFITPRISMLTTTKDTGFVSTVLPLFDKTESCVEIKCYLKRYVRSI